jgi:general secretion pathway protein G
MKKTDEGFTLIELLIVIVILGILAAVVVFAVGGITNQGEQSACAAELKTIQVAVEAYRAQEGGYPGSNTDIASFVRAAPTLYTVGSGGTITATAAGTAQGCAASG